MWASIVVCVLMSYMLGNLNGAVCMSALIAHDDVRTHGSGNAGLTNFIRNYGVGSALYVVLIDAGKAVLACLASGLILREYDLYLEGAVLGGLCVMLGHNFPATLGFRGGKGILSGWFIAWVVDWRIGALIFLVFALAYGLTGYVSLGSILGAATLSVCFAIFHHDNMMVMTCGIIIGALAVFMHRANIVRLIRGQERKTNLFAGPPKNQE